MSENEVQEGSKPRNILVVDDDITALDIVSFMFEGKGFQVHRCANGGSALEYVQKLVPDLILIDLLMPQMSGVETIRQIRELGFNTVPIIAFTAVDEPELHTDAIDAGCEEVVTKPCPSARLVKIIERYLTTKP